jgi:hypothetical protein
MLGLKSEAAESSRLHGILGSEEKTQTFKMITNTPRNHGLQSVETWKQDIVHFVMVATTDFSPWKP